MGRPDRHNELEINFLTVGTLTYLFGGRRVTIQPGALALFWAAIPHQIIAAEGRATYYVATLPLAWFLQCRLPTRLVQPILHGRIVYDPHPPTPAGDGPLLDSWATQLDSGDGERRHIVLLELEARLLRLALDLPAASGAVRSPPGDELLSKAEQVAAWVAAHYQSPLRAEDIGRAVGLHPNYAMTLFRKVFNTTINDYLTQHRLWHAQRLLATTDRPIIDVALDAGFGSISRFNAVFSAACACSPRRYRQRHRRR
jgi:AraC-like DNA-binding protein